jgi:hypothetical protein
MKLFAAVAAIVAGVLLLVIPRFVFPACEYIGRGRMHCTDAAHGEFVVGGLLVAAGAALALLRSGPASILVAAGAVLLCAAAFFVPAYTRYCANPDMACHYGMVPSVRFIAVAVGIVEAVALAGLIRESKRRDA